VAGLTGSGFVSADSSAGLGGSAGLSVGLFESSGLFVSVYP